jgi:dienelactone hydrolase
MFRRCLRVLPLPLTLFAALTLTAGPAAADASSGLTTVEVEIPASGGRTLSGTLHAPAGAAGPLPGLVLVHGSGNGRRAGVTPEAMAFARQGIAVLAVYGTGDTQVPPAESAAVLHRTVTAPLTVRFLPGAGHTLRVLDEDGMYTERSSTAPTGGASPPARCSPGARCSGWRSRSSH